MKFLKLLLISAILTAQAGLPPTSTKGSGESVYSTTFKTDYGTIPITRSGTQATVGTIPVTAGGTGGTTASGARTNLDVYSQAEVLSLVTGTSLNYFYRITASDIGGYLQMTDAPGDAASQTSIVTVVANPTALEEFATIPTAPTITTLAGGVYNFHMHAAKTAGTKEVQIYGELYTRTSGGVETLRATSDVSTNLLGTETEYDLHAVVASDVSVNLTDRLVVKWYGIPVGAGTNPEVTMYFENNTASRVEVRTTAEAFDTRYLTKPGLVGGQVAYGGIDASENLTFSSTINATKGKILFGTSAYDDNLNTLGLGDATPTHVLDVALPSDNNIFIDARTNQRAVTTGAVRVEHTPSITGTRAFNIDIDMNGQSDTHSVAVDYKLTGLSPGMLANNFHINYDTANSTGGISDSIDISKTGTGTAEIYGMHANSGVNPIRQTQGDASVIDTAYNYNNPTYTSITAEVASGASNATLFNTISDVLYIGQASTYSGMQVSLVNGANTSVLPTFEFWNGAAWTLFYPGDGTNGFTVSGNITWIIADLTGWATTSVNGVSRYWVRVTRTKASVTTDAVESTIKVQQGNTYAWDKNGAITASSVTASGQLVSTQATGTAPLAVSSTTKVTNLYADRAALADTVTTNANLTGDVTSVGNATTYNGTVPLNKGGTGQTTKAPAFDALSPMTTGGDVIYGGASGTGTRLANGSSGQVLTSAGGTSAPTWSTPAPRNSFLAIENISFVASVGSNALTIALKDSAGSDPSASTSIIGFRSSTLTSGAYVNRAVTASTSIVISSGSTLGHANATAKNIWLYAIDNAGTVELAVSSNVFDESYLYTTTAEGGAGAADSVGTLYSTTARSNVAIRLIGRLLSSQTTAGTWAAVPTDVSMNNHEPVTVTASYWLSANFTSSATVPINWDSKEWDSCTPACVTTSATEWKFTAPVSGTYSVKENGWNNTSDGYHRIYKGAVGGTTATAASYKIIGYATSAGGGMHGSTDVKLLSGEFIDIRYIGQISGSTLDGNGGSNIAITRVGQY